MGAVAEKVMALDEAISRYVWDGCHISIGGFTLNRNPMAAVYEMIRQGKKNLHCYAHSNGPGVDDILIDVLLIGTLMIFPGIVTWLPNIIIPK